MLVQDEPTSHLDMQSIEALQTCLKGYTGGIVLVTHDQHFCNSVAEKVPSQPFCLQRGVCKFLLLHCCPRTSRSPGITILYNRWVVKRGFAMGRLPWLSRGKAMSMKTISNCEMLYAGSNNPDF